MKRSVAERQIWYAESNLYGVRELLYLAGLELLPGQLRYATRVSADDNLVVTAQLFRPTMIRWGVFLAWRRRFARLKPRQ